MEFVRVKYWRNRRVFIDGQSSGMTNRVLAVGEGRHRFELSPPKHYAPTQQVKVVRNTSRARPLEIAFMHRSQAATPPASQMLGASAAVGGLCHAAERPVRSAAAHGLKEYLG